MNGKQREHDEVTRSNHEYRKTHYGISDADQPCSCGRSNCPGHGKRFGNYQMIEKVWAEVAKGVKKLNPETNISKGRNGKPFSGDGHIHPACAARALGRDLEAKDFVNGDSGDAAPWVRKP